MNQLNTQNHNNPLEHRFNHQKIIKREVCIWHRQIYYHLILTILIRLKERSTQERGLRRTQIKILNIITKCFRICLIESVDKRVLNKIEFIHFLLLCVGQIMIVLEIRSILHHKNISQVLVSVRQGKD